MAAPGAPALGIVTAYETYHSPSPNAPPRRTMTVLALVYINTGLDPNGIPDAVLNDIQDAIDAALKADDPTTGRCTLGGLVYSAQFNAGSSAPQATRPAQGIAVSPIDIVLP